MYSSRQPRWQLSLWSTGVHARNHRLSDERGLYRVCRCADLRFGAGVSGKLFEELAVSLIPHQGELSYELSGGWTRAHTHKKQHKKISQLSKRKQQSRQGEK